MINEINQDSIFPSEKEVIKKVEATTSKDAPIGYIPVKFSSFDKFGPPVLHFRNYTMDELLHLGSSTEESLLQDLVCKVLNKMVYEDFDCSELPPSCITQIMMSIYANFWGNTLYNLEFFIDESDPEKGIDKTDINLKNIKGIEIDKKFKVPFSVQDPLTKNKIKFDITRVKHVFFAKDFVKEYFKEKREQFSNIKAKVELIEKLQSSKDDLQRKQASEIIISDEERERYDDFLKQESLMYLRVLQCQLLIEVNSEKLNTIEEKLEAFKEKVDISAWASYKETLDNYPWGIDEKYTFDYKGEKITRRFSFRFMDFIPAVDQKSDRRFTVSFDD